MIRDNSEIALVVWCGAQYIVVMLEFLSCDIKAVSSGYSVVLGTCSTPQLCDFEIF